MFVRQRGVTPLPKGRPRGGSGKGKPDPPGTMVENYFFIYRSASTPLTEKLLIRNKKNYPAAPAGKTITPETVRMYNYAEVGRPDDQS